MTADRYTRLEYWLRGLPQSRQARLAIKLASLVEPFTVLSNNGQPVGGLMPAAEIVRNSETAVEVDRGRHVLFSMPELADEDEPDGMAWFPFRVTVAWIYAADCKCTAPGDGVVNTYKCVLDILDAADQALGGIGLAEDLTARIEDGGDSLSHLRPKIYDAINQLSRGDSQR